VNGICDAVHEAMLIHRIWLGALTILALVVGLYSLRIMGVFLHRLPDVDVGIQAVIAHVPGRALTHMLIAPLALVSGPFQFFPGLRSRHPRIHRWTGRFYVSACVVAGIAALATTPYASGGPIAGFGFAVLAILWVSTTVGAWRAALRRNFGLHRLLMRYSYAMTFAAVTLRLQIPIGIALGFRAYSPLSVWLAYTSWIPNVLVVALYSWRYGEKLRT
jgi:hypothetical protein